jgi:hypothetical protein
VVLAAVLSVSAISLPIVLFTYRGFEKMVDRLGAGSDREHLAGRDVRSRAILNSFAFDMVSVTASPQK